MGTHIMDFAGARALLDSEEIDMLGFSAIDQVQHSLSGVDGGSGFAMVKARFRGDIYWVRVSLIGDGCFSAMVMTPGEVGLHWNLFEDYEQDAVNQCGQRGGAGSNLTG